MLAIRMQRTGRRGHAQYRIIIQDRRFSPKSGRVVEYLGTYNPHTKETRIDKDKATDYLSRGAQPSDKLARLMQKEGIELPKWVKFAEPKKRSIKHPEKLRRNRPPVESPADSTGQAAGEAAPAKAEAVAEEPAEMEEAPANETVIEEVPQAEKPTEDTQSSEEPTKQPTEDSADTQKAA